MTKAPIAKVRLLGTSGTADVDLYKDSDRITIFVEKGKRGIVALSASAGDIYARGLFEIKWVGQNNDKIWLNLDNDISSKNGMSENGFDIEAEYIDKKSNYRIPFCFWNEGLIIEAFAKKNLHNYRRYHNICADGNVFCRYIVGDADVNDLETAANQCRLDTDPDFRREVARDLVNSRNLFVSWTRKDLVHMLETEKLRGDIQARDADIKKFVDIFGRIIKILNMKGYCKRGKKLTAISRLVSSPPLLSGSTLAVK
ncbi:MAG: hypothetical protein NTU76_00305 [Candidatus Taylorbacteria bacterium]|nr:hypothetical protein [Candidatus Taylorbacteria bacterium]